jgi:hypothetical protein
MRNIRALVSVNHREARRAIAARFSFDGHAAEFKGVLELLLISPWPY